MSKKNRKVRVIRDAANPIENIKIENVEELAPGNDYRKDNGGNVVDEPRWDAKVPNEDVNSWVKSRKPGEDEARFIRPDARNNGLNRDNHDEHESHGHRGTGKAMLVACIVLVVFLAVAAGCTMAVWDMQKKPSDLLQAIIHPKGDAAAVQIADNANEGDTSKEPKEEDDSFIEEVTGGMIDALLPDGLMSDMPDTQNEGENEPAQADDTIQTADTSEENTESATEETTGESESEGDDTTAEEGGDGVVTSAEVAGIGQIVSAASGQVMAVVKSSSAAPTTYRDPNESYPLSFQTVGEDYFADALFIGDSRLQGFGMWSGLPATYYCMKGFQLYNYDSSKIVNTESGKVTILEGIPFDAFTKIYIKVGLNEMGMSESKFEEIYAEFIAKLREKEPRAIIYIHAVLPVTAQKSATDKSHNNPNIVARNEALKAFAADQKAYYVDVGPYVSLDDGSLKPEMASDGIHMSAKYMGIWKQYLLEHAIVTGME